MWQYAPSDGHIAKNLVMVFNKLGWNQAAKVRSIPLATGTFLFF